MHMTSFTLNKRTVVFIFALLSVVMAAGILSVSAPLYAQGERAFFTPREDFRVFYIASELINVGRPADIYQPALFLKRLSQELGHEGIFAWFYPPPYLLVLQPLSWLSLKNAYFVSIVLQWALFLSVTYRFLWKRPLEALALSSPVMFMAFGWGQNGVLMAILYLGAFRFLKICPLLSGFFFGCCVIKPHLGVLLPVFLLAGRHYKSCLAACLTAVLLGVVSWFLYGTTPWLLYGHMLVDNFIGSTKALGIGNIMGIFPIPTVGKMMLSFGVSAALAKLVQLLVFAYCFYQICNAKRDGWSQKPLVAAVYFSLLSLLAIPYFNLYDYVFAVSAALGLVLAAPENKHFDLRLVVGLLLVFFIPVIHMTSIRLTGFIITPLLMGLFYLQLRCHPEYLPEVGATNLA